jgi:small subunit ribosomal protein S1
LRRSRGTIVNNNYEVGQIVRGRITKLVNFGAFARLARLV